MGGKNKSEIFHEFIKFYYENNQMTEIAEMTKVSNIY